MAFKNTIYPVIFKVPEDQRRLKGKEKVRFLSGHARAALVKSAEHLGFTLSKLEKKENGAPIAAGGVHWSISHKSEYVAGLAALHPVGIDIEKIRTVREGLHERIAKEKEWRLFSGDRDEDFYSCWTAKEAVLKASGVGIAGLAECSIVSVDRRDRLSASFMETLWTVRFRRFEGHLAAVAANRMDLCWIAPENDP